MNVSRLPVTEPVTEDDDRVRVGVSRRFRPLNRSKIVRALTALALAASVLAVAPNPAQGAAAEVDTRRLWGQTRYETAVEIAETYIDQVEGDSSRATVDTVILTSGEDRHFAYALPTPALSRLHDAPLLLTPSDELHDSVTTFLTRYDVATVMIVGGTSVVSSSVERSVDAISGVEVTRIDGDDEYDTAVAVADLVGTSPGSPGEFPRQGRTALLATGEAFADALAAGPLAYRGDHPILLSRSSVLPGSVEDFLQASRTEHVVILGGTRAVSTGVERDIEDLGIEVTRWRGSDRFGTAVEIAERLLGLDTPHDCFDGSELGLANGWRSPDAIVSGALLGELCAPLLLTELGFLPPVAERFLESDDFVTGDIDGELRFTIFGGTAAVSDAAAAEAVDASQLVELQARVSGFEGGCHFTVTFSDPVLTVDAGSVANYLDGNTPFESADASVDAGTGRSTTEAVVTLAGSSTETGTSVPTGCSSPLRARDRIGVVGGEIEAAGDRRKVARVEFFVPHDDTAPTLTLNAPEGSNAVWVESSEPLQAAVVAVVFERSGDPDVTVNVDVVAGATSFEAEVPPEMGSALRTRDHVTIADDEVEDLAGNSNLKISRTVVRDNIAPRVSRITVTEPTPREQASITLRATDAGQQSVPALQIISNAGEAADGAAGNGWSVDLNRIASRRSSWSSSQLESVSVSTSNERITIEALEEATVNDVIDELNRTTAFRRLFLASEVGSEGASTPIDTGGRVSLEGGASTVDLTVHWSEPVLGCDSSVDPVRPRLIEIDVDADEEVDFALDGVAYGDTDIEFVAGDAQSPAIRAGAAVCDDTTAGARAGTLVARLQSSDLDNLPSTRSEAHVRPGAATDLAGNRSLRQSAVVLRRP